MSERKEKTVKTNGGEGGGYKKKEGIGIKRGRGRKLFTTKTHSPDILLMMCEDA